MNMKDAFDEFKAVAFRIGSEEFAFHVEQVLSIEKTQRVTVVPAMPKHVLGVINLRGTITPVINLSTLLYSDSELIAHEYSLQRYIVVRFEKKPFALVVDEATDVLDIPHDSIQTNTINDKNIPSYLSGISKLENRLITIINVDQLLISEASALKHETINHPIGSEENEIQHSR
jgi:purine-binding chemotaxis protein CheW